MHPNCPKFKMLYAIVIAIIIGLSFSFSSEKAAYTKTNLIYNYAHDFNASVMTLDQVAEDFRFGKVSIDSLRHTVTQTRLDYKKVEFFLAFHYAEFVNEHLNGAPLLHIERTGTRPVVLEAEGLQVLDELVFSDEAESEKAAIAALAKKLQTNCGLLYNNLKPQAQKDQSDITAMRLQLVRIFTLGVTGFDTPGSLNALPETVASLDGMRDYFEANYKDPEIVELFDQAIAFVKAESSFEKFDRLTFLKNYIDPLYKQLGDKVNVADPEFLKHMASWNSKSQSIFANDFLDPYFFTELKKEENSAALESLGKTLFFDPILSNDAKMSCATCHQPEKAFADAIPKSLSSLQGQTVLRNAPSLVNSVYADRYFYDLRAFSLEQQAEHVFFNPEEFNTAYHAILKKLNGDKNYTQQFKKIFGTAKITREQFSKALASYVLSLNSFNSEFDKYVRGESADIGQEIKNGFNLFTGKANCATCHFAPTFAGLVPPNFSENESEILGVLSDSKSKMPSLDTDEGRIANKILSENAWIYEKSFKTTTVRNAGLTAPYFHNGAYETLEEVIEFYNKGGGEGIGITVNNQTLAPDELKLSETEKKELIAFIKSLNDVPGY